MLKINFKANLQLVLKNKNGNMLKLYFSQLNKRK